MVNKQSDSDYSENHWLKQFENKLQKGAVQPRQESLFDQINTIMNGKSKYTSVQGAVEDMMQRSGLTAYLDDVKVSNKTNQSTKKASTENPVNKKLPKVIQEKESILKTLENLIKDSNGNMPVPAIISRLHSLHANDIADESLWEDDDLIRFVSQLNLKAKANNPASYDNFDDLGVGEHGINDSDIDASNTDAFNILMPAKF